MRELLVWMAQGTAVVAVLMLLLWLLHLPLRNPALADMGRALGLPLIALIYALHGLGYWRRTLILLAMVLIWGLRLGFHIFFTRVDGPAEESGEKSFWYFEGQALLCGVLSIPFLLAMHDPSKSPAAFDYVGAAVWAIAFFYRKLEWLVWVSFAIVAFPAQYGYLGLIAPVLIRVKMSFDPSRPALRR